MESESGVIASSICMTNASIGDHKNAVNSLQTLVGWLSHPSCWLIRFDDFGIWWGEETYTNNSLWCHLEQVLSTQHLFNHHPQNHMNICSKSEHYIREQNIFLCGNFKMDIYFLWVIYSYFNCQLLKNAGFIQKVFPLWNNKQKQTWQE